MNKKSIILGCCLLTAASAYSQITERQLPKEWDNLITGGRFMDRIETMPEGKKSTDRIWGTEELQGRFIDNGIEKKGMSFWGGNILRTPDGRCHLFVCGWPESSPKGHMFWKHSTVYHAVADNTIGPFRVVNSIGKGHNPEAYRLDDGRVVVYTIDGYYIADDVDSKVWNFQRFNFDNRDRKIIEGLSNLTFARRQDSSRLMVCRGGGIWISKDGLDTYHQISDGRVYPAVDGEFEDPVVWRDSLQYHLIVNDWKGRIAWYERSKDGINWIVEPGEAYIPGISRHKDGYVEQWYKYERPKILQDKYGRAEQINFAVIDTIKWEDLPNDTHSSKNIGIPMNKGLLMEVTSPISSKTKKVNVRIRQTYDFNPQTDLDLKSLRFGSYREVNFGRGAKVLKTKKDGNNLIITFACKEARIEADDWAPKLIGKDKNGKMVFGYASRPDIDYRPAILSALRPVTEGNGKAKVTIENFGLSASKPCTAKVAVNGKQIGKVEVPSIRPYEKIELYLDYNEEIAKDAEFKVTF